MMEGRQGQKGKGFSSIMCFLITHLAEIMRLVVGKIKKTKPNHCTDQSVFPQRLCVYQVAVLD